MGIRSYRVAGEDPEDIERLARELGIRLPEVPPAGQEPDFAVDPDLALDEQWDEGAAELGFEPDPED